MIQDDLTFVQDDDNTLSLDKIQDKIQNEERSTKGSSVSSSVQSMNILQTSFLQSLDNFGILKFALSERIPTQSDPIPNFSVILYYLDPARISYFFCTPYGALDKKFGGGNIFVIPSYDDLSPANYTSRALVITTSSVVNINMTLVFTRVDEQVIGGNVTGDVYTALSSCGYPYEFIILMLIRDGTVNPDTARTDISTRFTCLSPTILGFETIGSAMAIRVVTNLSIYYLIPIVTLGRPVFARMIIESAGKYINPLGKITGATLYRVIFAGGYEIIPYPQAIILSNNIEINNYAVDLLCENASILVISISYV